MTADADLRIRRPMPAGAGAPRPLRLLRRIAGERAAERITRVLAFGFLPGAIVFGALVGPVLVEQRSVWPDWWSGLAFGAVVAPPIVLGAVAFAVPLRTLRMLAAVSTAGSLLVLATAPLVVRTPSALAGPPWVDQVASLGLIAPVIAMRPAWTVVVAVVGGGLTFWVRLTTDAGDAPLDAAQNAAYVLLFTITFLALGVSSLAAARAEDAAEDAAQAAVTRAAVDAARDREQARINALVHDRVLATLLTMARQLPGAATMGRRDAGRALDGLHALLAGENPLDEVVDGQAFVWRLQGVTTQLAPEALFGHEVLADLEVPGEAAEALVTATEEALRNSLRHAGTANRTVHARVDDGGVQLDVLDDGVGFDPAAVPPGRLGIARSISGRMQALPGGSAQMVSEPGVGTRVVLRWAAP